MNTFKYTTTSKTILADLYTPVGVYMRLRDLYPQSALMESSDYHDSNNSRSFIGIEPMASVAIGHGVATVTYPDGSTFQHEVNKEYRSDKAIHQLIDHIQVSGDDASVCGLFGYTSFNAVRYFEDIPVKDETQQKNDAPDLLYKFLSAFSFGIKSFIYGGIIYKLFSFAQSRFGRSYHSIFKSCQFQQTLKS